MLDLVNPGGSNIEGILAWSRALLINLLHSSCLILRPTCFLQAKPWRPFGWTITPQMHLYWWHSGQPRRKAMAILREVGSRCRPKDGIGIHSILIWTKQTTFKSQIFTNFWGPEWKKFVSKKYLTFAGQLSYAYIVSIEKWDPFRWCPPYCSCAAYYFHKFSIIS